MKERRLVKALGVFVAAVSLLYLPAISAQAYAPEGGVIYQVPADQPCLKGRGNCAIYVKSAQLPNGRLVATFEKATVVPESQGAAGETLPVYKSDDLGTSWQALSEVKAPAYLSSDPQYAKYTSNWGSPYLYTLPQDVGNLKSGTLLLASTVTGEDAYYKEHKAADPNWVPTNDGDRSDVALALFSSTDSGVTWNVLNVIATGGWQGGSAGAAGQNIAAANTNRQVDPLWEPFLMVHAGKLVVYYSDENDYIGFDPATGVPIVDPNNATAPDSIGQILVHKTWDGSGASWSTPVVDVAGATVNRGNGKTEIGGGRPGMTTIAQTTDGKWLLTYEYWGGGANVRFKIANDPLKFYAASDFDGEEITGLPVDAGSRTLSQGGSPVLITLPDGRIVYNASGSGDVWVNDSGRSDGVWTEYQTPVGAGYTRNLQYVQGTGRVVILQGSWGGAGSQAVIRFGEVDLGKSDGAYYRLVNRKTGQVMGTGNNTNDANIGNANVPDVVLETAGAVQNPDTQYWHVVTKADGNETLLNKSGGREASIWTANATAGQRIGQWVDNKASGAWNLIDNGNGYYRFQAVNNTNVYLTGSVAGSPLTLQNSAVDGSQDWQLVAEPQPQAKTLLGAQSGKCLDLKSFATNDGAVVDIYTCNGGTNQKWTLDTSGQLVNASSGKCLDVSGQSTSNGAFAQQWTCTGGGNQKWTYNAVTRQLIGQQSGKCLDVNQASTADGARLVIWTCGNQTNQQWTIR
ncbi:RICIN domain-containing protein [Arthrobacter sp. ISL-48]|uniref:RICIN domain-containing protein n=1 Tax=Arthrobacter sp. ISL-48 TaxID=2819110 RepID=UPI001BE72A76|nr:RICIN domain-containing protein [Arthrobacter sp. ISL-48]MBT2532770.1 RICIN domain-containing protein [Arthrobacter sp. ISL-48]